MTHATTHAFYTHTDASGRLESVLGEVVAMMARTDDDDANDAGVDFLLTLKKLAAGIDGRTQQMPAIHWRTLLPPPVYLHSRDVHAHSLLVTKTLAPASTDVRSLLACNGKAPIDVRVRIAVDRHARM